jgi:hypothetical protein
MPLVAFNFLSRIQNEPNQSLDFASAKKQKQLQVTSFSENFYSQWRAQAVSASFLRDEDFPTERLLQAIWQHQRLKRGELKTAGGKIVRVFHPGFASVEADRIFAGQFCRLTTKFRVPAMLKLICAPTAGARTVTTKIQISKAFCFTSFGTKQNQLQMKVRPQFCL